MTELELWGEYVMEFSAAPLLRDDHTEYFTK